MKRLWDFVWWPPLEGKVVGSRKTVERLNPRHGKESERPMYVGWAHVPYLEGSWIANYGPAEMGREPGDAVALGHPINGKYANTGYTTMLEPDGPIYFVGDLVSYLVGWQEGAALSSLRAIKMLSARVEAGM